MSRSRNIEKTAKSFIAYLVANLPARLVTKAALWKTEDESLYEGNAIPLPDFNKYYFGDRISFPREYEQIVMVAVDRAAPRVEDIMKIARRDDLDILAFIVLNLEKDVNYADEWLNKKIIRYAECMSEIVEEDHTINKKVRDIQELDCTFQDIMQKGDVLFKIAIMRYQILTIF